VFHEITEPELQNGKQETAKKKVCIVLPTYNEAGNIPLLIPAIFGQASKIRSHDLHVLVVDDNSPDGTQDIVRSLMKEYPALDMITGEKKGLGEAYKKGMDHAIRTLDPDLIFEMDADLQHDPTLIPLFVELTRYGFSMIIGSRFVVGGSTPNFSFYRRAISLLGNWLIRFMGGLPRIHDCTSGYRCIKAELIRKCDLSFLSTRGYSFQSSLLCELIRNGASVVEIPIVFPDRTQGQSKLSMQDQIEFLTNIPKIRFRQSAVFIKFCIVGGSGVIVNMGVYAFLTRLLHIPMEFASPVAIELSILSNFFLNNFWTFRWRNNNSTLRHKVLKFHIVSSIAAVINYALLLTLVKMFGVWDMGANLAGIAVGTFFNYAMNSLWTWKELETDEQPE